MIRPIPASFQEVEFLVRDGMPCPVDRCSMVGEFDITCGQRCIETVANAV